MMQKILDLVRGAGYDEVGPGEAREMARSEDWILLDVRSPKEHRKNRIPGTDALIPLKQLRSRIDEIDSDRLVVYCRSGNRSGTACRVLEDAGIEAVNLSGGIIAWSRAGLPVE